jgi:hypothetical protein
MEQDDKLQKSNSIEHNLNDVWTVLRRQGESIAKIDQGQNSIVSSLADFRAELRAIRDIATRPAQPVNWIGVAALCVSILIAGGSYATSVISPVKENAERALDWQETRSRALIGDYNTFGAVIQKAEHTYNKAEENTELLAQARERIARLEGHMESAHPENGRVNKE